MICDRSDLEDASQTSCPKKESLERALQLVKLHGSTICSDAYDHDDFSLPDGADLDAIYYSTSEKETLCSKQTPFSAVCKLSMRTVHFATTRL